MVQIVSAVSGHHYNVIRERLGDKVEAIKFDPWSELSSRLIFHLGLRLNFSFSPNELCLPREEEDPQHVKSKSRAFSE